MTEPPGSENVQEAITQLREAATRAARGVAGRPRPQPEARARGRMLYAVPIAISSPGRPGMMRCPGLLGCTYLLWLPSVLTWCHPSASRRRTKSRTFITNAAIIPSVGGRRGRRIRWIRAAESGPRGVVPWVRERPVDCSGRACLAGANGHGREGESELAPWRRRAVFTRGLQRYCHTPGGGSLPAQW